LNIESYRNIHSIRNEIPKKEVGIFNVFVHYMHPLYSSIRNLYLYLYAYLGYSDVLFLYIL